MRLTLQYLEDRPELAALPLDEVVGRLRVAFELLPLTHVLLGWNVPPRLREACREETQRGRAKFMRWQPLLTGDGSLRPPAEWRVVGLQGARLQGFRDMDEFTFVCPNRLEARQAILEHIDDLLAQDCYDGYFLDRIRYPSPARDPLGELGCFCDACHAAAAGHGLDLAELRGRIRSLASSSDGVATLVSGLLGGRLMDGADEGQRALAAWQSFRQESIRSFVAQVAFRIRAAGLEVGLDAFSPCLAPLVGQDLHALGSCADWVKVMTYGRTLGPAGIPFELLGLADFLVNHTGCGDAQALSILDRECGLGLPSSRVELAKAGIRPQAVGQEVDRAKRGTTAEILAGIEAVYVPGVAETTPARLEQDLRAVKSVGAVGLSISWDLLDIPEDHLRVIRQAWIT